MMPHTNDKGSKPYGFRPEDFFNVFPSISLCKTCDRGRGHFWPHQYNLNKIGRGPLGDASYQIKALGLTVSDKIFPCFSLYKPV